MIIDIVQNYDCNRDSIVRTGTLVVENEDEKQCKCTNR